MENENQENQEIGELIREITGKGFTGIVTDVCDVGETRFVAFTVTDYVKLEAGEPDAEITVETHTLVEGLRLIVDMIRRSRGEPTLAEEVEAMLAKEMIHEALPPIWIGPDARCRCGSSANLIAEVPATLHISWKSGRCVGSHIPAAEKARCPDCGAWYQLNA